LARGPGVWAGFEEPDTKKHETAPARNGETIGVGDVVEAVVNGSDVRGTRRKERLVVVTITGSGVWGKILDNKAKWPGDLDPAFALEANTISLLARAPAEPTIGPNGMRWWEIEAERQSQERQIAELNDPATAEARDRAREEAYRAALMRRSTPAH
jgi:hypothetical protein